MINTTNQQINKPTNKQINPIFICLLFLFITVSLHAQSGRFVDSAGNFKWQYHRSVSKDAQYPNSLIVTVVFINGDEQTAISYRQEIFQSKIEWIEKENGSVDKEGKVEFITANLAPYDSFVWKFRVRNIPINKDGSIDLEKAAFLIMNERFQVRKEKFLEQRVM